MDICNQNEKQILFEYLSRSCFDSPEKSLTGFMILDDGSFLQTKYTSERNVDTFFSLAGHNNLDENNCEKHLIWSSQVLAIKLQKLIDLHQKEINNFPEFITNNLILDGDEELIRIIDKLIFGCNIFYQVPYMIDQYKFKNLSPEQQSNEKALELLTLFYNEIQTILLKEFNHFNGFSLFCMKCKKHFALPLGEQVLSTLYDFKEIIYICPNCGTWEHKKVHLFNLPGLPGMRNKKREIDNIEDEEPAKKCANCNELMSHYEQYNPLVFNKLMCPDCNTLLEDEGPIIFN